MFQWISTINNVVKVGGFVRGKAQSSQQKKVNNWLRIICHFVKKHTFCIYKQKRPCQISLHVMAHSVEADQTAILMV